MDCLDNLEKRIETLINIIGLEEEESPSPTEETNVQETANGSIGGGGSKELKAKKTAGNIGRTTENIVDTLLSTNNIINEAVSEHEQIRNMMNRAEELEKYLDPQFLYSTPDLSSKQAYLNAVSPDLQMQFAFLQQINSMQGTLGAEYFRNVSEDYATKLKEIDESYGKLRTESEQVENDIVQTISQYGDAQKNLMQQIHKAMQNLELLEKQFELNQIEEREASPPPTTSTPSKN